MRRQSAIVSVVFGWDNLVAGEIRMVDLVGLVEKLHWCGDFIDLKFCDLVHLLNFLDVALEFRRVGRARGQVFRRLDIF